MKAYATPILATNGSAVRDTLSGPTLAKFEQGTIRKPGLVGAVSFYL